MRRIAPPAAMLLCVSATFGAAVPQEVVEDVFVQRLGDRAVRVGYGGQYGDSVLAIATDRGLVMIDTGIAPSLTAVYRAKIQEAFGRNDFTWVINTHFHFDHTDGNQVFPEATIVGHELVPDRMRDFDRGRTEFAAARRARNRARRDQLAGIPPDSDAARRLRDLIPPADLMCDDLETDFVSTPPTLTFSDRLALDLGDTTLRLYAFGPGTHTGDDVVVHVPELDLVATGDLFFSGSIRFLYRLVDGVDVARKLAALDAVLDDQDLAHVVTVHNGVQPRRTLELWRDYMRDVWTAVSEVAAGGGSLADVHARLDLERNLAYLSESGIPPADLAAQHRDGVAMVWLAAVGGDDATRVISEALESGGVEAAWTAFRKALAVRGEGALVDEQGINGLGYRLLQTDRVDHAIAVFEMNREAFPDAWNVHDSLGEAYMTAGRRDEAITCYRRSLELNPDNANGVAMLERLQAEPAQP